MIKLLSNMKCLIKKMKNYKNQKLLLFINKLNDNNDFKRNYIFMKKPITKMRKLFMTLIGFTDK